MQVSVSHPCLRDEKSSMVQVRPCCLTSSKPLTHWDRVTHICVSKLIIIDSDNGLSPVWRQAIIWTNAGILLIGPLGTNFSEILSEIHTFSFKKMRLKMSSGKWRPFCLGLNVLTGPRLTQYLNNNMETQGHCKIMTKEPLSPGHQFVNMSAVSASIPKPLYGWYSWITLSTKTIWPMRQNGWNFKNIYEGWNLKNVYERKNG